jgi:hypothetical protein
MDQLSAGVENPTAVVLPVDKLEHRENKMCCRYVSWVAADLGYKFPQRDIFSTAAQKVNQASSGGWRTRHMSTSSASRRKWWRGRREEHGGSIAPVEIQFNVGDFDSREDARFGGVRKGFRTRFGGEDEGKACDSVRMESCRGWDLGGGGVVVKNSRSSCSVSDHETRKPSVRVSFRFTGLGNRVEGVSW